MLLLLGATLLSGAAEAQMAPGTPGNLRAIEGDGQLALHWTTPTSGGAPTSYQYRQKSGGGSYDRWIGTGAGTRTEYVVTSLSNDTTYTFQVRATNSAGNSTASGEASGTPKAPQAKLYWTESSSRKTQRSNLNGSTPEDIITGLGGLITALAVDAAGGKIYYFAGGSVDKIQRVNLDGTGKEDLVISGVDVVTSIALDVAGGKMYWIDTNKIQRANLDGSSVQDLVTSGLSAPVNMALDVAGGKMYWTDAGTSAEKIQRANLDGSTVQDLVTSDLDGPAGIALDVTDGKMYWTDTNKIQRANISGGSKEDLVTSNVSDLSGIALDVADGKVYWTNNDGKIWRAKLSDGSSNTVLLTLLAGFGKPEDPALLLKPGKPRDLTAAAGDRQVSLQWKAPTPDAGGSAASYEYRHKTVAATYTRWADAGTTTSTVVTGLTNGTEYTFRVRAGNRIGNSPASATANAMPTPTPPGAPMNLTAAPGNARVMLSWTASTGTVTGYQVRWKQPTAGTYDGWTSTDNTGTSHTVVGLTNGTRYEFQVRAVNSGAFGPESNTASAMLPAPPGAPTNLAATPGNARVMLSWAAPTGTVTAYQVRWKAATGTYEEWTPTGSTDTSHAVIGLTNGTQYEFQVQAVNSSVPGPVSDTASTTPQLPPGAPMNLTATPGNARVMLSWTASTGTVTGYEVQWKPAAGTYDGWMPTGGTDTSHAVIGLTNGTRYEFQVRAVNNGVPGPASGTASAAPQLPPGAPTNLMAAPGNEAVTLSWTASTGTVTGYEVWWKTATLTYDWTATGGTNTSHTVAGLTGGTRYEFQVRALHSGVPGPASNTASATPTLAAGTMRLRLRVFLEGPLR